VSVDRAEEGERRGEQRMEGELRASEERFRLLVESVQDYAIFLLDPAGRVSSWNAGAEKLKGYREREILGEHFSRFYPEPDGESEPPAEKLRRAAADGRVQEEGWRVRKDGSHFWADVTITALRDHRGELVGFAKVTRDLTDRRRAEVELRANASRLSAVFDGAGVGIALVGPTGSILKTNPALSEMLGYSGEELQGKTVADLTHPHDLLVDSDLNAELLAGRRNRYQVEKRYLHRSGEVVWGRLTVSLVDDAGPTEPMMVGMVEDITDRKRVESERARLLELEREARGEAERRAEQETALREAVTVISAAFTVEETTRRIAGSALAATRADGAFVEHVDVDSGSVFVAAVAGDLVPAPGTSNPFQGSFTQKVIESEEPAIIPRLDEADRTLPLLLADRCGDCSAAVIPLLDAGEPVGSLVLVRRPEKMIFRRDEVERAFSFGTLASLAFRKIHLLEDSERRREELQQVTESRARLMRGFSHDVKNPLGAADGYLSLLEDGLIGELSEKQIESVGRVRRLVGSALGLIEDLLELARAEAGQLQLELAATDVREATREMTEEYRAQAVQAGLELHLDVPDELSIIESDPTRVRQVVSNLVSNAIKYTPAGGEVRVRVSEAPAPPAEAEHGWTRVDVQDTGPGIPPEQQALLFEEFTRLDPDRQKGAGIGLAISQKVARALGGRISVESSGGPGSTFTLWLPLRRVGERRERDRAPAEPGRARTDRAGT
jgi:PAS domain S-box-containing protein